jgi:hypothetical protein
LNQPKCNLSYSNTNIDIYLGRVNQVIYTSPCC